MRRLLIGPLAATAAIATLLIGSAGPASATHSVEVGDSGTLVAKGAGVLVPVTVVCQPGSIVFPPFPFPPGGSAVNVAMTQRSGNRIAQGSGGAAVVRDGTPQTVTVQVSPSQAPFKQGTALVTASMTACDPLFARHTASDTEEITLTK